MRIWIIRHGLTEDNLRKAYGGGRTDKDLLCWPELSGIVKSSAGAEDIFSELQKKAGLLPEKDREWNEDYETLQKSGGVIYVSPMKRARETAEIYFPKVEHQVIEKLREMDFGIFEGRSAMEMVDDRDYRRWVAGGCQGTCPGGESRPGFNRRIAEAITEILEDYEKRKSRGPLIIVAHGGVQMAFFHHLYPARDYYSFQTENGDGICVELDLATLKQRFMQ